MGKTSLAIRAALDCKPDEFKRTIFVSVKNRELDDDGLRVAAEGAAERDVGPCGSSALSRGRSAVGALEVAHELGEGFDTFGGEGVVDGGADAADGAVAFEAV
jgi:hypothetical protein